MRQTHSDAGGVVPSCTLQFALTWSDLFFFFILEFFFFYLLNFDSKFGPLTANSEFSLSLSISILRKMESENLWIYVIKK